MESQAVLATKLWCLIALWFMYICGTQCVCCVQYERELTSQGAVPTSSEVSMQTSRCITVFTKAGVSVIRLVKVKLRCFDNN